MHFDSPADLRLAVLTGKVDAALADEEAILEVLRDNTELSLFGDPLLTLPLGVGFRKDNTELRDAFNRFLGEIRQNGVHADMVERWVGSAWLLTEKHFRKVIGHEHVWTLAVSLGREESEHATEKVA